MQRRVFLKTVSHLSALLGLSACGEPQQTSVVSTSDPLALPERYPVIPALSGSAPPRATIHALLEELRNAYETRGLAVSASLQPPISDTELRRQCAWFPGELPEEIYHLYSWRGGQLRTEQGAPFWFRDVIFSTPEKCAKEYASLQDSYGTLLPPKAIGVDLKYCFPFASFNGGWYTFPCRGQAMRPEHPRSIIVVMQGVDAYFYSLEALLRTCVAWVKHSAYGGDPGEWENVETEIWKQHNPGVFSG